MNAIVKLITDELVGGSSGAVACSQCGAVTRGRRRRSPDWHVEGCIVREVIIEALKVDMQLMEAAPHVRFSARLTECYGDAQTLQAQAWLDRYERTR